MVVSRDGNEFTIHEAEKVTEVIIRVNDAMLDFDSPVVVRHGEKTHTFENVKRTESVIEKTLAERSDINAMFSAEVRVPVVDGSS